MLGKKAFIPASNKENDLGPLNMLRKAQKSRKEQLERKLSSRNIGDINVKENININKDYDQKEKMCNHNNKPKNEILKEVVNQNNTQKEITSADSQKMDKEEQKQEFRARETQRLMKSYAHDLIKELLEKESKYWCREFLAMHTIPANIRAKMIDWMIEV